MSRKLETLRAEFDKISETVTTIHNRASSEARDLTEQEDTDIAGLYARADELKPLIEKEVANTSKLTDVAAIFARANGNAEVVQSSQKVEVGPKDYFMRAIGNPDAAEKIRALDVVSSSSSAGLIPYTIQGDIISFSRIRRQTINSLQHFPVPNGSSFKRRVFTAGTTIVGAQGSENTEVATGSGTVAYVDVTPATYSGAVRFTLQSLNDTAPNAADMWMKDVTTQYANNTNIAVAAAFKAAVTTTASCNVLGATYATIMSALMGAADTVLAAYGEEADTIWVSPDVKSWLATVVGSDGHPIFPLVGPMNAGGTVDRISSLSSGLTIGGLKVVVEPHFATSTFIVGCSLGGEVYESMYPVIEAWVPSTLAKEVAMAGELATYFRAEAFVEMVDNDGSTPNTPNFG